MTALKQDYSTIKKKQQCIKLKKGEIRDYKKIYHDSIFSFDVT